MPNFKYIVRDKNGKPVEGSLEAQNEDELVGMLQSQDYTVVSFSRVKVGEKADKTKKKKRRMHHGVKIDDLIVLSRQLSTLLNSGVTLLRSLEIIIMQVESVRLHTALEAVKRDISIGSTMKSAVARHPKVFSKLWVNVVDTGETTGQLPFALEQLTSYMESTAEFSRKILNAIVYPSIILCVTFIAIGVFVFFIIPMFEEIYAGFDATLPAFTQFVFFICRNLRKYSLIFVGLGAALFFGLRYYGSIYEGRKNIDRFKLNIFIFGDLIRELAAARFANALNMLLKSGTPILQALDIVIETSGNVIIMEMLQRVKQNVREGKSMAEPLIEEGILPDMLAHMVAIGEESGELANMLDNAAAFYSQRVETVVQRLTTLFEPFLIIFVGIIVGTLVIAMFLPIFGLASAIK
ncbi:MAG: type II secretion system F family protein [Candidatus Omnitrophota bacterium]